MARFRWLSTFSVLGILLIVLGIVGEVLGPKFVYDPGQVADGREPLAYLTVGVLMLLNAFLSPAPADAESANRVRPAAKAAPSVPASPAAASRTSDTAEN